MAKYSSLCERCLKRIVDCERFYQDKVEQCDEFIENDFDLSNQNATINTSFDVTSTHVTGLPNVLPDEQPVAELKEVQEEPENLDEEIRISKKFLGKMLSDLITTIIKNL